MKISIHITCWYSPDRLKYLKEVVDHINQYSIKSDIFIHTQDNQFSEKELNSYDNGLIEIIYYEMKEGGNPPHGYYLTWKCRDVMKEQVDDYDIFMYLEDDIGFPNEALSYWLNYKDLCLKHNYNLGFFRVECKMDRIGREYRMHSTDLLCDWKLSNKIKIEDTEFVINDVNPYCGSWIYDQNEFKKFSESDLYSISKIQRLGNYGIRESSAWGLSSTLRHKRASWYKDTIVPLVNGQVHEDSKLFHLPNNYFKNSSWTQGGQRYRSWGWIPFNSLVDQHGI